MNQKHTVGIVVLLLAFITLNGTGADREKSKGHPSPQLKFRAIDLNDAQWTGGFWRDRYELNRTVTIPTMKQVMERPTNAANFHNLRLAAGEIQGKFSGTDWGDGDCYKWIEAAASIYRVTHDPGLDREMDEVIAVIAKAQAADGYISTQIQLTDKGRWTDLHHHELYNMGHLLSAACVHHHATGKETFLNVARKLADHLFTVFEPRPKELAHFCFNPANIMGAVELYRTTGERKYLHLAEIFVTMRGSQPGGSDQNQAKVPLRKEMEAVGHAVTATYLWSGAADVYAETGESALLDALGRLWTDVSERKMYITGAIGALHHGESQRDKLKRKPDSVHEAFGAAYQLPNRTAYNETCANIGNAMWNWRMLELTGDAMHADVMERVFYNSMLSGIGLDGQSYFYTNPLRREGKDVPLLHNDSTQRWTQATRDSQVYCFCCPPNLARTIAQLQTYAYGVSEDTVWVHLYGSSKLETQLADGSAIRLTQTTDYPWDGKVSVQIGQAPEKEVTLRLRVPGWAREATVKINGKAAGIETHPGTYCNVRRRWLTGDTLELNLPMPVELIESHPLIEENRNQVAVMRGPLVYCLESVDLPSDIAMADVSLSCDAKWKARYEPGQLRGITVLETQATAITSSRKGSSLYHPATPFRTRNLTLRMIPYYAWSNRGSSEMSVWLPLLH